MAREVDALLGLVFAEQRQNGRLDLEAIEMAMRAAMHRVGAGGLEQLLEMSSPVKRAVDCGCGQQARFHEMRPKHIVTALGRIRIRRAYYLCSHCQQGPKPGGFGMGYRRHGVLSGRAENDGSGGQRGLL
jgi:hypothetical protein